VVERAMTEAGDLFAGLPTDATTGEAFTPLLAGGRFRVERIVSFGHASPAGFWYEQAEDEWVMVLAGAAGLRFEGEDVMELRPGAYVNIPAGRRHRVEWTEAGVATVWLAIHYGLE
jgi:cupin 2 domain-containing protein